MGTLRKEKVVFLNSDTKDRRHHFFWVPEVLEDMVEQRIRSIRQYVE